MNWIEKMIAEKCPNGVKKMPLGGLITRSREKAKECKADVYAVTNNRGFVKSDSLHEFSIYSADTSNYSIVRKNHIAYNPSRLNIGSIALFNDEVGLISPMYVVFNYDTSVLSPKFLFLFLKSDYVSFLVDSKKEVGARFRFDFNKWNDIYIPLPPLSIQEEIVSVLDKFSELIEKTDEEIALRQKQYEYYREKLLTFEDGEVEWKPINKIGQIIRGNGLQKSDFTNVGTGCIHYGQIYTKLGFSLNETLTYVNDELAKKLTKVEPGNLVIACTSENIEDVCKSVVWLGKDTIVTGGHACVFKHKEDPKYIGYCFLTRNFFSQKKQYAYGAKVIDIKKEKLEQIKLPIPSLSRQQKIVDTLDKFEALISKLKEERELRQKQYEYYREKLLTF